MGDWRDSLQSLLDAGLPQGEDTPPAAEPARKPAADKLHIYVERKGRGGKIATIIAGFTCDDDTVDELARQLRRRLGAGGSCRGGEILIQGDRGNDVAKALADMGYKTVFN